MTSPEILKRYTDKDSRIYIWYNTGHGRRCDTKEEIKMPFIDSKVSVKVSKEQETELKSRLGQAISIIPGKSESWLMVGIEDEDSLYFRGDDSEPMAFIEVRIFGGPNRDAFEKMTAELTKIYGEVLGIAPDHMYIKYSATTDWGWNGSNF
jgi:phenylpyruvate tautomerase PptA (4-oxalocrotonate tautomerase family)